MPQPTPQQHKEMWAYIVVLTLVIVVLWGYFFKNYLSKVKIEEPDKPAQSWQQMLAEIKQSVNQGSQVIERIKQDLKNLPLPAGLLQEQAIATGSASTVTTQAELLKKLKDKLEQNNP